MIEDLARKIAFPLQLDLGVAKAGDVEHETAVLHDPALRVGDGKSIDQDVGRGPVFATKGFFVVAQHPALLSAPSILDYLSPEDAA